MLGIIAVNLDSLGKRAFPGIGSFPHLTLKNQFFKLHETAPTGAG